MNSSSFSRVCVVSTVAVLAACGGGSDSAPTSTGSPPPQSITPAAAIAQLEANGVIPKLDRSSSLTGIDVNNNGVRDDVDAYIQSRYASPPQRAAAVQLAQAVQSSIVVDVTNTGATKAVSQRLANATRCLFLRLTATEGPLSPGAAVRDLEAVSTNTKSRLKAYLAYSKAVDGAAFSLPKGDTCE